MDFGSGVVSGASKSDMLMSRPGHCCSIRSNVATLPALAAFRNLGFDFSHNTSGSSTTVCMVDLCFCAVSEVSGKETYIRQCISIPNLYECLEISSRKDHLHSPCSNASPPFLHIWPQPCSQFSSWGRFYNSKSYLRVLSFTTLREK